MVTPNAISKLQTFSTIAICGHRFSTGGDREMAQDVEGKTRGTKRLTEAGILRIRAPAKGRIEIADAIVAGLRFRITDRDKRSWSPIYRTAGTSRLQQRVTLGSWPAVGVAEARKRAKDVQLEAMAGNDPAARKRKQEARAISSKT